MIQINKFKFTGWVYLSYDRKSPEFNQAFNSYREGYGENEGPRLSDFLAYVAGHLTENGHHLREIEDIGYVQLEGDEKPAEWCGIVVARGYNGRHIG